MKILWLCNLILPEISKNLGLSVPVTGGWLDITSKLISEKEDMSLSVCAPKGSAQVSSNGTAGNIEYFLFSDKQKSDSSYFIDVINKVNPDIIHIFGTEYQHSLSMMKAAEKLGLLDRTIIHIQGLCSIYAKHYFAFLDNKTVHKYSLRDVAKGNIYRNMLEFKKRGNYEIEALKITKNVAGRTDWDEACTKMFNPDVNYHFCNETLRNSFYNKKWDVENCERHSIFVSQSSYPIKGFHIILEALSDIIKQYPNAKLYTTGKSPLGLPLKERLKQSYYSKYLGYLIKKYSLENNIVFLGHLDENKMCERYLKSNVFVCCSSIENSPNSLGEAMILGVPCVSSDVGGVKNMLTHEKEGFVYQSDAPYMLSYYVKKVFADDNLANNFSNAAQKHASLTHNPDKNFEDLINIYHKLINN